MNPLMPLENQFLVTKFYVPVARGSLISRPRLISLLNESLRYPLTLVSAPAGFGKTTLLSMWVQSLPDWRNPSVAWVSLDEEDNDPRLFWTCVLTALDRLSPVRFTPLLMQLQSPLSPPLKYILARLINLLAEETQDFLLILDDYHLITEQQVHTTFLYLVEHLPPQLHIIVATRVDPPLPLTQLRVRGQLLQIHTEQLRFTVEETRAFFDEVIGIQLPDETIQEVIARTEGWLVGLKLLGLSLPDRVNPANLLKEISGDQRYILDYLTEEVLQRQPQEVQKFLLSTSILERFSASLCDAVMDQTGSQQMLQQIEKANLFVVSLDNKQEWYRYHTLFAEALRHLLKQTQKDLVPTLHHRASLWYTLHSQTTYSCFISYSSKDQEFVEQLYADLQSKNIRCWYAPRDMVIGDKIRMRIDESIRVYDKLLVILSENSVASEWVAYEVEKALNKEPKGVPNVLYPIRLDKAVLTCTASWAQDIRETRHIGDFERWKDDNHYLKSLERLLRALKTK
jgi:LuxR family maltose regulon positive regulatory protein